MRPKVAVLTNIPSPYQVELFDSISRHGKLDLRVWYCAERDARRLWQSLRPSHWHRFGRGWRFSTPNDQYYIDPQLSREIVKWRPDLAVFSVYAMPAVQLAIWHAVLARIPWVYWGESVATGGNRPVLRLARRLALYPIQRWASGLFAVGRTAVTNFQSSIARNRIVLNVPYFSNLARFSPTDVHRPASATRFLYVGSFIYRKGVDTLARAFSQLVEELPKARLVIAGDGDTSTLFDRWLSPRAAAAVIRHGFVSWENLPELYRTGDVLVMPSRYDGWGLVVPEAMASGLPVVGSSAAGAVVDLVRQGVTGWEVPPGDPGSLQAAMKAAATIDHDHVVWMRGQCLLRARRYDVSVGARVFARAVSIVLRNERRWL